MTLIAVSSSLNGSVALVKANLTATLLHEIGEAFTLEENEDEQSPFSFYLRSVFGQHLFRWYAIDASATVAIITFSNVANPKTLTFRGQLVRIATADADRFELSVQESEVIKPVLRRHNSHKTFIQ